MSAISPSAPAFILCFSASVLSGAVYTGASDGLLLWFHTVLPTLAPAMICTRMLLLTGGDRLLIKPLRPLFCRFFALSDTGAFILLSGMICGYPLGPALCAQALEKPDNQKEAAYLLAFCSFPSPMFLAGYIPGQFQVLFRSVFFFWESIFRHFCCHGLPDTDFPHSAFKFRGIGKQRTAAKKQKPGQRSL